MNKVLFILFVVVLLASCAQKRISETGNENIDNTNLSDLPDALRVLSEVFQSQGVQINYELWDCGNIIGDGSTLLQLVRTDLTYKEMAVQGHVVNDVPSDKDVQRILDELKVGFILFDGVSDYEFVVYRRNGINHRWDWGDWRFAFVIEPDGRGLYFDFEFAKEDGVANARDVFKCEREYTNLN